MASISILRTLFRELITTERSERQPEPDLVMDDPEKVAAFTRAGREDGVMAPVYLFNCANICDVICSGDTVIDLGCGPATQLAMVARLNPDVNFIGVDLSDEMLDRARLHIKEQQLDNVTFEKCDISNLAFLKDKSVDAVISTVVLHHLPTLTHLDSVFSEVSRVLKSGGGVFIIDFSHLKSEKSINYFAYQYADRQPELFTLDYLYSLRAAFYLSDYKKLNSQYLEDRIRLYSMFLMPFMVAIKSPVRREVEQKIANTLSEVRENLPDYHKTDVNDLVSLFGLGGMKTRFL